MITKEKMPRSVIKFSQQDYFLMEMYGDQFGEFVCGYWGLKGYPHTYSYTLIFIHSLTELVAFFPW